MTQKTRSLPTMPASRRLAALDDPPDPEIVARVAHCLDEGGLVALPTETVYGLFCRASREDAIRRVFALKGRPDAKPLPFAIPNRDAVHNFVNALPRKAARLIDRFWPGPLTLVLGPDDGVALRLPDVAFTRSVLEAVGGPVHATSANPSGAEPASSADATLDYFPEGLDLVVDGGPVDGAAASAIVRVTDTGRWKILRPGEIPNVALDALLRTTVLVICTGNTCRSPMAAAVLRDLLAREVGATPSTLEQRGFRVLSAGVAACPGSPMTTDAVAALHAAGIPAPTAHEATPVERGLLRSADLVYVMTRSHGDALRARFPEHEGPVLVADPHGDDVADPIGGGPAVYAECLDALRRICAARLPEILASGPLP